MNYNHNLQFGTFLTPRSDDPQRVVDLARRSEELGYDLVTFQDHPYQPAFLDTWTLLAWAAGVTERVHLAANVLNLPLRSPAVLARSAASLDLLSGGRLELALGAGAFWDAIEANGGPRRTPAEAVDAFSEAVDAIRGLLDTGSDQPLRLDGRYYPLDRPGRGPTPAHTIPIWVGALGPRMLRRIGQKADGWLPSLPYLKPGDLSGGNRIIDEAARAAGRDPREIRRLLNISGKFNTAHGGLLDGPAEQWVADLLPLAVQDGVSTFILMSDDPQTLERFAHEVIPALREAVQRELPDLGAGPALRSAAVRARRHPGIDYDAIPAALAGTVIEPGDVAYARVKSNYMRGGSPGVVFQVETPEQVAAALAYARQHPHVPLSVRSRGHGISGRSTNHGGIIIDLKKMDSIAVLDRAARRVRIGPGARWMDVAVALDPYGWALSSGDYGGVGVGGLATAGGIGWLSRAHGLTIDHLRAVEMVLADGSQVRASETEHPDLFWAVRGAGANFGIATAFEFEVDEVGEVGWGTFLFDASDAARLLERWGAAVEASPRDLTSFIILAPPRGGQPAIAQMLVMVASPDADVVLNRLQPLAAIAPLYDYSASMMRYADVMSNAQDTDHDAVGEPSARSGLLEHITPAFAAEAARLILNGTVYFFQIRAVGGAVNDVPADATAYAHRSANFNVAGIGANRERLTAEWDRLRRHFDGLYLSFETDLRPERLNDAFPPPTLERLRDLKARYDPHNVFRDNFNIAPLEQKQAQPEGENA